MAGPDSAAIVAVEQLQLADRTERVRRVLRYRIDGERFAECWLYEESQAVIDEAWS